MAELKPCPKCGQQPERQWAEIFMPLGERICFRYACRICGIKGGAFEDMADAADDWNRRADHG